MLDNLFFRQFPIPDRLTLPPRYPNPLTHKNRFNCSNRSEDDYRLNFFMDHGFYCRLTGYYNKFVRKDMDLFNPFRFIYRRLLALLLSGIAGRTCKCCRSD